MAHNNGNGKNREQDSGDLRARVLAIESVETLPHVVTRIMTIVNDEDSTALDLATEIARDQALTLKILRTVNSSYYGFQRRILTVPDAVVVLGFDEVERLAITIAMLDTLGIGRNAMKAQRMLWRHSLACSMACGVFEIRYIREMPELRGAHIAGLLHDVGKAVLAEHFPAEFKAVLELAETGELSQFDAEQQVLDGFSHCDVGAWLADAWGLPEALVESIRAHHPPAVDEAGHPMACVTHVVDALCNTFGIRSFPTGPPPRISPAASEKIPMDENLVVAVRNQLNRNQNLMVAVSSGAMY